MEWIINDDNKIYAEPDSLGRNILSWTFVGPVANDIMFKFLEKERKLTPTLEKINYNDIQTLDALRIRTLNGILNCSVKENETLEQYHQRLRDEKHRLQAHLKGTLFWDSQRQGTLIKSKQEAQ
jgi:hypothetical protein